MEVFEVRPVIKITVLGISYRVLDQFIHDSLRGSVLPCRALGVPRHKIMLNIEDRLPLLVSGTNLFLCENKMHGGVAG